MAVPKKRTTRSKRGMRRSHDALKNSQILFNVVEQKYARRHYYSAEKTKKVNKTLIKN